MNENSRRLMYVKPRRRGKGEAGGEKMEKKSTLRRQTSSLKTGRGWKMTRFKVPGKAWHQRWHFFENKKMKFEITGSGNGDAKHKKKKKTF